MEISIGKATSEDLNEKQKEKVGNAPVFTLSAKVGTDSVHELGGKATITVDYTPAPGEDMSKKTVFYIDDDGNIHERKTTYVNGKLSFETLTFSMYYLGDKAAEEASGSGSNDLVIYAAIAIGAILIVGLVAYFGYFRTKKA